MEKLILFGILSIPVIFISWHTLFNVKSHGFYRFFSWGIFLKNTTGELLIVTLLSTTCLYITAIIDEKECVRFFGSKYEEYMKGSKMFIPFII